MKIVCVIPARLGSLRFPRKVLCMLGNQPLLQWVWEAATRCPQFDEVVFAIDDQETAALIDSFGGKYLMSSPHCTCGTERLIELLESGYIQGDVWVNWQGDEPFICPQMIEELLETVHDPLADIWTLKKKIKKEKEIANPHVVKVVTNSLGSALYFSRSPIPYRREPFISKTGFYYKHIGLYAFRQSALKQIQKMPPSSLEDQEGLEQLRFLENGLRIQVHETTYETIGIDHPYDLKTATAWINKKEAIIR